MTAALAPAVGRLVGSRRCSIEGCDATHFGRGWRKRHYDRWRLRGDPLAPPLRVPHVVRHGTVNEYRNYGCRCADCREANTAYCRDRGVAGYATDDCPGCDGQKYVVSEVCWDCFVAARAPEHGTESRYCGGCRCPACRAAAAAARRRRRAAA